MLFALRMWRGLDAEQDLACLQGDTGLDKRSTAAGGGFINHGAVDGRFHGARGNLMQQLPFVRHIRFPRRLLGEFFGAGFLNG